MLGYQLCSLINVDEIASVTPLYVHLFASEEVQFTQTKTIHPCICVTGNNEDVIIACVYTVMPYCIVSLSMLIVWRVMYVSTTYFLYCWKGWRIHCQEKVKPTTNNNSFVYELCCNELQQLSLKCLGS